MRVTSFKTLSIYLISIVFVFLSCQKQLDKPSQNENTPLEVFSEQAKAWFSKNAVLEEIKMLNLPYNILPEKSPKRIFARMVKMQKRLVWGKAKLINREGLTYLIVPVSMDLKEFDDHHDFAKFMIFSKTHSGEFNGHVLEILSKKATFIKGKEMEIATTAFYNRELNKNDLIDGINAYVFFYDEKYKKQNGFEISFGNMTATKTTLKIRKNNSIETSNLLRTTNCELWGMFCDTYNEDGVLLYSTLLYTYYVGDCGDDNGSIGNGDSTESGDPEYSGGGNIGDDCSMTTAEASELLSSVMISINSNGNHTSGSITSPDINGRIKKPVIVNRHSVVTNYGSGYFSDKHQLTFNGVLYKINSTSSWKWESLLFSNIMRVSGTTPPCLKNDVTASVSGPIISSDKSSASFIALVSCTLSIDCIAGTVLGTKMVTINGNYYATSF